MSQTYSNHRYQPVLSYVVFGLGLAAATSLGLAHFGWHTQGWTLAFLITTVMCLAWVSRVYSLRLQNRIIKMEMHYRTDQMLAPDVRTALWKLSRPQIIALRFASDAELPGLIARTSKEQLSPRDIKQAIKDWQGDFDRT